MTDVVRWGILGTGKIAKAFASALKETPDAVLAGVGSRNAGQRAAFTRDFGGTAYARTKTWCRRPTSTSSTSARRTRPITTTCAWHWNAGKGVLCEKPLP
jgi:predicted dehydrogenase